MHVRKNYPCCWIKLFVSRYYRLGASRRLKGGKGGGALHRVICGKLLLDLSFCMDFSVPSLPFAGNVITWHISNDLQADDDITLPSFLHSP